MQQQKLPPAVVAAAIVLLVVILGYFGWKALTPSGETPDVAAINARIAKKKND